MADSRRPTNVWYVLLVAAGAAFTITACAYGVMTFRAVRMAGDPAPEPPGGLIRFLDERGGLLMTVELVALGLFSAGAVGTERARERRSAGEARAAKVPSAGAERQCGPAGEEGA